MQLNAYLLFNGQCEEAFKFYEKSFGGRIQTMMAYAGSPMESHVPSEWRNKILHATMFVGNTQDDSLVVA
jgi:PhnB protein